MPTTKYRREHGVQQLLAANHFHNDANCNTLGIVNHDGQLASRICSRHLQSYQEPDYNLYQRFLPKSVKREC